MGVEDQPHAQTASTPWKDPVPIVQEASWAPQGRFGRAEKFVPTGNRSRTVQPVVSRYTDSATPTSVFKYIQGIMY